MKRFRNILFYFLVIFFVGVTVVSAEILLDSSDTSYSNSNLTSQTTVKGALDELFSVPTNCPTGYTCKQSGAALLMQKASANPDGTLYASSIAQGEPFIFNHSANSTVQVPQAHTDYRYIGGRYCSYNHDAGYKPLSDGTCPDVYYVTRTYTPSSGSAEVEKYVSKKCPTSSSSSITYSCEVMHSTGIAGTDPNNYIDYNGETWRILGVFSVDDGSGKFENRIKIMRNEAVADKFVWNTENPADNVANDWVGGALDNYLNGNSEGNFYNSLSDDAKSQIDNAVFYLGGSDYNWGLERYYRLERDSTASFYSEHHMATRKVGLFYGSDFLYTYASGVSPACLQHANDCDSYSAGRKAQGFGEKGWLYAPILEWTMTADTDVGARAYLDNGEFINVGGDVYGEKYVSRPVVYLKASVELSGTGAENDHYKITAW